MTSSSSSDHILLPIGYIRKPHGLKGEVKVHIHNDKYSDLLEATNHILVDSTTYTLETVRWQHNCALLKLEGINDASTADKLKTLAVSVELDPNDNVLLPDGLFLPEQWINYQAFDEKQTFLGTVKEVIYTKCNDVISISNDSEEILVPVTEEYILSENHDTKQLTIKNPDYL